MNVLQGLLKKWFSRERRQADRLPAPGLAAFFWTGAAPVEHGIRDISSTGFYLVTEERWYPGTLIAVTLQKADETLPSSERSIAVQSKAVRWGEDGVGLEFVLPEPGGRKQGQTLLSEGADRKTLERFLKDFVTANGTARVDFVGAPADSGSGKSG